MSEELEPCPECGGEAKSIFIDGVPEYESYGVACQECGSQISGLGASGEAITAWNFMCAVHKLKTAM